MQTAELVEIEIARLNDMQLSREDVNELIAGVGKIIGIDALQIDDQGMVELIVDDHLELSLIHLNHMPGVVVTAAMPPEAEQHPGVLRQLLQANMFWRLTQGGCFIFVPPRVALCRLIPVTPADPQGLDEELGAFVGLARHWHEKLAGQMTAKHEVPTTTEPAFEAQMIGLRV